MIDKYSKELWVKVYEGMLILVLPDDVETLYFPVLSCGVYHRPDGNFYERQWKSWETLSTEKGSPVLFRNKEDIYNALRCKLEKENDNMFSLQVFYDRFTNLTLFEKEMNTTWDRKSGIHTNMEELAEAILEKAWNIQLEHNELLREKIPFRIKYWKKGNSENSVILPESSDELKSFLTIAVAEKMRIIPTFSYFQEHNYTEIRSRIFCNRNKMVKNEYYSVKYADGKYLAGVSYVTCSPRLILASTRSSAIKFMTEDQAIQYGLCIAKECIGMGTQSFDVEYTLDEKGGLIYKGVDGYPYWLKDIKKE